MPALAMQTSTWPKAGSDSIHSNILVISSVLAKSHWKKCTTTLEKFRNTKLIGSEHYDFDTYPNGIEIVEVEFKSEKDMNKWVKPKFIGREITGIKKYSNIILAKENLIF